MNLYLGIDVGTSGVRTAAIDAEGEVVATASIPMAAPENVEGKPCQDPGIWWECTCRSLDRLAEQLQQSKQSMADVKALAVDGTSGTLLLADAKLNPVTRGYMYNSSGFDSQAEVIARYAPENSLARGPGSTLARLLYLQAKADGEPRYALHQADWIAAKLMNQGGMSDETNVLKMGYDVQARKWPDWFSSVGVNIDLIPTVAPVGEPFGTVGSESAGRFGLAKDTTVVAGATDSNAAFLASGAAQIGDGVTSLGTTMAIKLLSDQPIVDPVRGVYSHRIKEMWLPGGASNTGGAVLLDYFTPQRLEEMEQRLDISKPTGLDYYPLTRPGERFPIANPQLPPRLTPRPDDDVRFYQAILEGIANIERRGYEALSQLGAPQVQRVFTSGRGSQNEAWTTIRSDMLGVPVLSARWTDAAVGAARIAAKLI